jgi:DNA-binding NtrC family response regulator
VAEGGTLFLDEIGDMPIETQAKILRVLQEKELERVGGNRTIKVDVRILAATNQDLEAKVKDGTFREDLYYRLNVVAVVLPSLRERPEDVPLLVEHFLETAAKRLKREPKAVTAAAYRALCGHEWKGNVREMEHAIEQALVLASGSEIDEADLPPSVRDLTRATGAAGGGSVPPEEAMHASPATSGAAPADAAEMPTQFKEAKQRVIERFEREFIEQSLARHRGNISKAAEDMGMYRQHLQVKLGEYGIDPELYRRRS